MNVLTVNAGSTSMKLALVNDGVATERFESLEKAAQQLAATPGVVVHRLVHGGSRTSPVLITDAVRIEIGQVVELDPLHETPELNALDEARAIWPAADHVACFDTGFHTTIPAAARHYALPEPWRSQLPAYGFHGLSHAWSAQRIEILAPAAHRVVVAHLGGGSSLCGLIDGRSRVTTMGFTPLDGLVMATRVGHLDPGAVLWLTRHADFDVQQLLSRESGLFGLTGSTDMHEILNRARHGDDAASYALAMWEHRFLIELGGCIAALGGIDALVFTGGIGENATRLREQLCDRIGWLGVSIGTPIEIEAARPGEQMMSNQASQVGVFVIPAREDLVLANEAELLVGS